MDEADKNELIAWSKRGNILTRLTSFVGISQKQNQVSFMTSSSVHGAIVKADHFEQSISEARMKKAMLLDAPPTSRVESGRCQKSKAADVAQSGRCCLKRPMFA